MFSIYGYPDRIRGDNGPPFKSHEIKEYFRQRGIHHKRITPLWPRRYITDTIFNFEKLELINGAQEHFNIVIFLVADLGYIKDIIGKCSSTALYGCYHCIKNIQDWHAGVLNLSNPQTVKQYVADGEIGLKELGQIPNKESSKYKSFIKKHYG